MKHVVVVIPIDTKIDEAQNIAQEYGDQGYKSFNALAVRHLHLQHHDGDDDGYHTITERFKPILSHAERARHQKSSCGTPSSLNGPRQTAVLRRQCLNPRLALSCTKCHG